MSLQANFGDIVLSLFHPGSDQNSAANRRFHFLPIIVTACFALGISAVLLTNGPTPVRGEPWDIFIVLEGAWRMLNGQVPNLDFQNPIGPLVYWLTEIGMRISGPSLTAYVYGNVIFLAFIAIMSAAILPRKLPPLVASILSIYLIMLVTATRPLGFDPTYLTYAMIYNRYSWALFSLLVIALFADDANRNASMLKTDNILYGILLGTILICKISFFIIATIAIILAYCLRPNLRRWAPLMLLSFVVFVLAAVLIIPFDLSGYYQDVSAAAKAQSLGDRFGFLKNSIVANLTTLLILILLWTYFVFLPFIRKRIHYKYFFVNSIIFAFVVGAAFVITTGNAPEHADVPLFSIAGILVLEPWQDLKPIGSPDEFRMSRDMYAFAYATVIIALMGPIASKDALGFAYSYMKNYKVSDTDLAAMQEFRSPNLDDFFIPRVDTYQSYYSLGRDVPQDINDGLEILRRYVNADSKLVVFANTDPFSYALGLIPPKNIPLWNDANYSFSRTKFLSPENYLKEADFVIIPVFKKGCWCKTVKMMEDIYNPYLERNFSLLEKSEYWRVFQRNAPKPENAN